MRDAHAAGAFPQRLDSKQVTASCIHLPVQKCLKMQLLVVRGA